MKLLFKKLVFVSLITGVLSAQAMNHHEWLSRLDAEFGVELPLHVALSGKASLHRNFYFSLGVGWVNEFFLQGLSYSNPLSYASSDKKLSRSQIDLISQSLVNSLYGEMRLGYRQDRFEGFYGELGWSLMTLGKGKVTADVLKNAIGREGLNSEQNPEFKVQSMIQNATIHAGYKIPITEQAGLSLELGLVKPLLSDIIVDYGDNQFASEDEKNKAQTEDAKKIKKMFLDDVWVATGSMWLSYTF